MSRFSSDCDYENPIAYCWDARVRQAVNGKRGQRILKELCEALLALPERRLISGHIVKKGEYCAVGAYAAHKGVDLSALDGEPDHGGHETVDLGKDVGLGMVLAWHLGWMNDELNRSAWMHQPTDHVIIEVWDKVSDRTGKVNQVCERVPVGPAVWRGCTPEERWQAVYEWAASNVKKWDLPAVIVS